MIEDVYHQVITQGPKVILRMSSYMFHDVTSSRCAAVSSSTARVTFRPVDWMAINEVFCSLSFFVRIHKIVN